MILTFLLSRRQISYVSVSGVYCSWQVANDGNQKEETIDSNSECVPRALAFWREMKREVILHVLLVSN